MNKGRKINKLSLARQHRKSQYLTAINKVIDGEAPPEYATERWKKLKEIDK